MSAKSIAVGIVLLMCWVPSLSARANDAETAFRQGQTALSSGDLRAAFAAFARAAKLDSQNQSYLQQATLVRQVILLTNNLPKQQNPQQWEAMAQAIRAFYVSHGLYDQALPLDQAIFDKQPSANSAIQFAETLMALNRCSDAAGVLASVETAKVSAASQALLAVALARQGKQDEARKVQQQITVKDDADPGTLYIAARMQAALGDTDQALGTLTQCFEAVPPSKLAGLKLHARNCPDFAAANTSTQFVNALKTESKVTESKCSGGSSCGSCPMRGNCDTGKETSTTNRTLLRVGRHTTESPTPTASQQVTDVKRRPIGFPTPHASQQVTDANGVLRFSDATRVIAGTDANASPRLSDAQRVTAGYRHQRRHSDFPTPNASQQVTDTNGVTATSRRPTRHSRLPTPTASPRFSDAQRVTAGYRHQRRHSDFPTPNASQQVTDANGVTATSRRPTRHSRLPTSTASPRFSDAKGVADHSPGSPRATLGTRTPQKKRTL